MADGKLYFAYGSNINLDQMAYRCPAAHVVGPVTLEGYELLFRSNGGPHESGLCFRGERRHSGATELSPQGEVSKRSLCRRGVATIGPKEGSAVHGLLWEITPDCERSLDHYEGYPHLYGKEPVTVRDIQGQEFTVMAYVMTERYRMPAVPPMSYYYGIEEGYRQNGLPVVELKKAWENAVREVHQETERMNASFTGQAKPPKRRGGHDR